MQMSGGFEINLYLWRPYYIESYKILDQHAQNIEIGIFTMGIGTKHRYFHKSCIFS